MANTIVAGVGMVKFVKPGQQRSYRVMAAEVIGKALADAGLEPRNVRQAYASFVFGETGAGQHAVYDAFQTGIPIVNVNNACASGSTALYLARQAIESGALDCALVVGFEEMPAGPVIPDTTREYAGERIERVLNAGGCAQAPAMTARWFGAAGLAYLERYRANADLFAQVAVKSRRHAAHNPYALFTTPITVEQVLADKPIFGTAITRLMACPPTCGAAAAILVSADFARRHGIGNGVEILAQAMTTDTARSWTDPINAVGGEIVRRAAREVYEQAGIGPEAVDVVELHDCFTPNEVLSYENLGLCADGEASAFVARGDNTYGGACVVNPSGGLMSKGHPMGATGVAQCCELTWQLRGAAGARQVPDVRIALQHNIGLVAAAVVTLYGRAA